MLTISQITRIYSECIDIKFKNKPHPEGLKGEYDPAALEVIVYRPAVKSSEDRDITLLHEFVHARDDTKAARLTCAEDYDGKAVQLMEQKTEQEAIETYEKRPYALEFIKQIYRIS